MSHMNNVDVSATIFDGITTPQEIPLLVAFFDLTKFYAFSQSVPVDTLFNLLSDYFEFAGDIIESSGGKVIKFIGDAGLMAYPEDRVDAGVMALLDLKRQGDAWLADRKAPSRNHIQAHFGPVKCGLLGTRSEKRFDIIGETVNTAATLKSTGVVITPQVFRKLQPETRKFFKKHTPPITYISLTDQHQN